MYSNANATTMTVKMSVMPGASGILQHDLTDDVADVAAAINDLLQQFIKVLDHDDLDRLMSSV